MLGKLIDDLHKLREERRAYEAKSKELEARYHKLEEEVLDLLKASGLSKATGKKATATANEHILPNVREWDKFYAYIRRSGQFHLLHKRISEAAYRELLELKGEAFLRKQGVESFNKPVLSLKTI